MINPAFVNYPEEAKLLGELVPIIYQGLKPTA